MDEITNAPCFEEALELRIVDTLESYVIQWDLINRGLSRAHTDVDKYWDDAEVVYEPTIKIVGIIDNNDFDILPTLGAEGQAQAMTAVKRWIENNIEADDRFYYNLIDAKTGGELQ